MSTFNIDVSSSDFAYCVQVDGKVLQLEQRPEQLIKLIAWWDPLDVVLLLHIFISALLACPSCVVSVANYMSDHPHPPQLCDINSDPPISSYTCAAPPRYKTYDHIQVYSPTGKGKQPLSDAKVPAVWDPFNLP